MRRTLRTAAPMCGSSCRPPTPASPHPALTSRAYPGQMPAPGNRWRRIVRHVLRPVASVAVAVALVVPGSSPPEAAVPTAAPATLAAASLVDPTAIESEAQFLARDRGAPMAARR